MNKYEITLNVDEAKLEKRRENFKPIKKELKSRWLKQYRALVTNASKGGVLEAK